jgi:hypothetical protein
MKDERRRKRLLRCVSNENLWFRKVAGGKKTSGIAWWPCLHGVPPCQRIVSRVWFKLKLVVIVFLISLRCYITLIKLSVCFPLGLSIVLIQSIMDKKKQRTDHDDHNAKPLYFPKRNEYEKTKKTTKYAWTHGVLCLIGLRCVPHVSESCVLWRGRRGRGWRDTVESKMAKRGVISPTLILLFWSIACVVHWL